MPACTVRELDSARMPLSCIGESMPTRSCSHWAYGLLTDRRPANGRIERMCCGDVHDTEHNIRLGPPGAASNTVTSGEVVFALLARRYLRVSGKVHRQADATGWARVFLIPVSD